LPSRRLLLNDVRTHFGKSGRLQFRVLPARFSIYRTSSSCRLRGGPCAHKLVTSDFYCDASPSHILVDLITRPQTFFLPFPHPLSSPLRSSSLPSRLVQSSRAPTFRAPPSTHSDPLRPRSPTWRSYHLTDPSPVSRSCSIRRVYRPPRLRASTRVAYNDQVVCQARALAHCTSLT